MRKVLSLFIAAFLLLIPVSAYADAEIGKLAPALVVKQFDGQTFNLADQRGKVVVLSYWATWCPPCREEMPMLNVLYKKYRDKGVVVFGLDADRKVHRDRAQEVLKGIEYPGGMIGDAEINDFGWISSLPVTFLIDRKGVVRTQIKPEEMPISEKSLTNLLEPLLAQ